MNIQSNIWKFFIFKFTQRRNIIPLVALFFLTIPDTHVRQIGIYVAIGALVSFLLEIPTGYFADTFGHKKTLILSSFFMTVSTLLYIIADSFIYFAFAAMAQAVAWASQSGAGSAFLHETLEELGRDDFSQVLGRLSGLSSLISVLFIFGFPFLYSIETLLPFKVMLIINVAGLVTTFFFVNPRQRYSVTMTFKEIAMSLRRINFYPTIMFLGILAASFFTILHFREPYVVQLGLSVMYVGGIMALSRLVWFFVGLNISFFERFTLRQMLLSDIILFPLHLFLIATLNNPYVVGLVMAVVLGYYWGRNPYITDQVIKQFIHNKKYKATILSIKAQMASIIQIPAVLLLGYVMGFSFKTGFYVAAAVLFSSLAITFLFVKAK